MSNTSAFDMPNIGVRLEKNGALLICSVLPARTYIRALKCISLTGIYKSVYAKLTRMNISPRKVCSNIFTALPKVTKKLISAVLYV